jgi:hypothetical protein
MNKEFVPYEQALALKELGFNNENCFGFYNNAEAIPYIKQDLTDELKLIYTGDFEAPLYQQAFRWFREKHDLVHRIDKDGGWWVCAILDLYDEKEQGTIEIYLENCYPNTYEEAELACLIKLIEIVKNK